MGFRAVPFMLMDCLPFSSSTFAKKWGVVYGKSTRRETGPFSTVKRAEKREKTTSHLAQINFHSSSSPSFIGQLICFPLTVAKGKKAAAAAFEARNGGGGKGNYLKPTERVFVSLWLVNITFNGIFLFRKGSGRPSLFGQTSPGGA